MHEVYINEQLSNRTCICTILYTVVYGPREWPGQHQRALWLKLFNLGDNDGRVSNCWLIRDGYSAWGMTEESGANISTCPSSWVSSSVDAQARSQAGGLRRLLAAALRLQTEQAAGPDLVRDEWHHLYRMCFGWHACQSLDKWLLRFHLLLDCGNINAEQLCRKHLGPLRPAVPLEQLVEHWMVRNLPYRAMEQLLVLILRFQQEGSSKQQDSLPVRSVRS